MLCNFGTLCPQNFSLRSTSPYRNKRPQRVKHNHKFNLAQFFLKWQFPFSHMLRLFQNNFVIIKATSSDFFRVPPFLQKLIFWSSYFFRAVEEFHFQNSHILVAIIFSGQLFFSEQKFYGAATYENRKLFSTSLVHFSEQVPFCNGLC